MRIPLHDLREQYRTLAEPIQAAIDAVLRSGRFILGPQVDAFEQAICTYCDVPHAVGVSSGTDALLALLMALGIGQGDAVITTAYTFFATAGSIARAGAKPLFVDIDPITYNIRRSAIEEYIHKDCQTGSNGELKTRGGEKLRAIIPVHLFGLCCDMDEIHQISEYYQLDVIEDAELAKELRILRDQGMEPRYHHRVIGGNFRLDEIQAAILAVKLPHLESWSAARCAAADFYWGEFAHARLEKKITLPAEPYRNLGLKNHHIYHQYVIRTPMRDALREHLAKREIETAIYYPLGLHEQKCFAYLGYKKGDFAETERAAHETLALPIYPGISRAAQRQVVGAIAEFFE